MVGEYLAAIKRGLGPSDGVWGKTATGGVWVVLIDASDELLQMGELIAPAALSTPTHSASPASRCSCSSSGARPWSSGSTRCSSSDTRRTSTPT